MRRLAEAQVARSVRLPRDATRRHERAWEKCDYYARNYVLRLLMDARPAADAHADARRTALHAAIMLLQNFTPEVLRG